ncbi:MAG: hypothetical protein KGL73_11335, partial [Burkholderiales bacterium]|nr:hypothetical protein [Burkholderiales bacterium]
MRQLEHGNGLHQVLRLSIEAAGGCGHLFHQGCVLLRGLVHLRDGFADLGDARVLLLAGRGDLRHDARHSLDGVDHFAHGLSGLVDL